MNRSMKSFLKNSDIEMYFTHNKEKAAVVERFIRTLKTEIYKYKTSNQKMFVLITYVI